jgi:hypothetical protein
MTGQSGQNLNNIFAPPFLSYYRVYQGVASRQRASLGQFEGFGRKWRSFELLVLGAQIRIRVNSSVRFGLRYVFAPFPPLASIQQASLREFDAIGPKSRSLWGLDYARAIRTRVKRFVRFGLLYLQSAYYSARQTTAVNSVWILTFGDMHMQDTRLKLDKGTVRCFILYKIYT